jgi:hypothetical protein
MINQRMARSERRGGLHATPSPNHYTKEGIKMRNRILFALIAAVTVMGISVSSASANVHQAHKGACARGGDNISVNVHDFAANGVVGQFGSAMGIKSFNGSVTKQMISQLVIGKVAVSVTTSNHGCDGSGGVFGAGGRALFKGEHVAVKVPASIGKSACAHPGEKGCVPKTITVSSGFPTSCWNLNTGTIRVVIWVHKKHKKHKAKKKAVPPPSCTAGFTKSPSANNQCVQIITEGPKTSGTGNCNSTNSGNLSGVGEAQGSCNVVVVNCQGTGSCAPETTNICTAAASGGTGTTGGTGGTGIAEACNEEVVVPPPCGCEPPPPPPPPPCETCECRKECKHPPQISVVWPPHIFAGGGSNQAIWIQASDPDGDVLSTPNIVATKETAQFAHVSSVVEVDVKWNGEPCPPKVSCYRGTLWGDQAGKVHLVASVTAGGESASVDGYVNVEPQPGSEGF